MSAQADLTRDSSPQNAPARHRAPVRNTQDIILLRVVGLAVPLVAGIVLRALEWWQNPNPAGMFAGVDPILVLVVVVGIGVIATFFCGLLLRSWWSLLAAPVAFVGGVLLWDVAALAVVTAELAYWQQVMAGELERLGWYIAASLIGAALGTTVALYAGGRREPPQSAAPSA